MNKFKIGDDAIYKGFRTTFPIEVVIKSYTLVNGEWVYECDSKKFFIPRLKTFEYDLMTLSEYQASLITSNWTVNLEEYVSAHKQKSQCVCGAHKVQSSRHSSWCEISSEGTDL